MADTMNYTEVWESAHGQAFSRYIAAPFQLTGTTNKASEVVHYSAGGFSWAQKQCSAGSAAGWCLQASAGSAPWRAGEEVCAATSVCLSAISFLFAHVNIHTSPFFLDLSNSGFFYFFFPLSNTGECTPHISTLLHSFQWSLKRDLLPLPISSCEPGQDEFETLLGDSGI